MDTVMLLNEMKLNEEIGKLLKEARKQARLDQKEVGNRLGFKGDGGQVYVSRLERGKIENPSMWLILKFLTICEKPWTAFFEKLANTYFSKKYWQIVEKVPAMFSNKKTDKAISKYLHSIDTKFAYKQKIKPLTEFQKQKMATGYARHQAFMNMIEKDITYYLGDSGEPYGFNQFYKAFARQYYSWKRKQQPQMDTDKKKEKSSVKIRGVNLDKIIERWMNRGLKREILEKIKEIVEKYLPQRHGDTKNLENHKLNNEV